MAANLAITKKKKWLLDQHNYPVKLLLRDFYLYKDLPFEEALQKIYSNYNQEILLSEVEVNQLNLYDKLPIT